MELREAVSARELGAGLGLELAGPDRAVRRLCRLDDLAEDALSFALPSRGLEGLAAGTVFGLPSLAGGSVTVIRTPAPRLDFIRAQYVLAERPGFVPHGGPPRLHPTVRVAPGAVIEDGVSIAEGTIVGPNAVVRAGTRIGRFCEVKSCAVIGDSGFGFERDAQGRPLRMIHLGGVRIGDHVEVGALATVARGALGDTVLGDYVKVNDHVHIAHNCRIGMGTIIGACADLSGSLVVGERCWIAPNASIRQKLVIGAGALVGIGAVVIRDVEPGARVVGNPARRLP